MKNLNGVMVLDALQTLDQPATLKSIVSVVATACSATPNEVHETVKSTLQGGVTHGYVQCANRKYFTSQVDADETSVDVKDEINTSKIKSDGQPQDASRRRGHSRKRRSSRSRSRRRRSRR